eukprot:gene7519-31562_t
MIEKYPFISQVLIATVKTSAADVIVQMVVERKEFGEIDWRRNLLFATFGCLYLGGAGHFFYITAFGRIFGVKEMAKFCNQGWRAKLQNRAGLKAVFGQVAADCLIIQPVFYWPGEPFSAVLDRFLARYKTTFWEDNFGMTYFWVPANIISAIRRKPMTAMAVVAEMDPEQSKTSLLRLWVVELGIPQSLENYKDAAAIAVLLLRTCPVESPPCPAPTDVWTLTDADALDLWAKGMNVIVALFAKYGIYTILDLHQDVLSPRICGEGAPMWVNATQEALGGLPFPLPLGLKPVPISPAGLPNCSKAPTPIGWSSFYLSD